MAASQLFPMLHTPHLLAPIQSSVNRMCITTYLALQQVAVRVLLSLCYLYCTTMCLEQFRTALFPGTTQPLIPACYVTHPRHKPVANPKTKGQQGQMQAPPIHKGCRAGKRW